MIVIKVIMMLSQAKLHYLKIISELPSYGAKCFSTTLNSVSIVIKRLIIIIIMIIGNHDDNQPSIIFGIGIVISILISIRENVLAESW